MNEINIDINILDLFLTGISVMLAIHYLWRVIQTMKRKEEVCAMTNGFRLILWSVVVLIGLWIFFENKRIDWMYIVPAAVIATISPVLIYTYIEDETETSPERKQTGGNHE